MMFRPGVPNFETGQLFLKPAVAAAALALFQDKNARQFLDKPVELCQNRLVNYLVT